MKAVRYDLWSKTGRKFVDNASVPKAGPGQVVVAVEAAAINPVDYKLPKLVMHGKGVGLDLAGVVRQVGEGVEGFEEGDKVYGNARGTLADFVLCEATKIAKIPPALSFEEAAAMPTVYLTGYQSLVRYGFQKGMSLLILGASGGCGTAGVQLAKALGAKEIIGVCSTRNIETVKELGATGTVDYTSETVSGKFGEKYFDFVYDCATNSGGGEDYIKESEKVLKQDGTYVAINGPVSSWMRHLLKMEKTKRHMHMTEHSRIDLEKIAQLMQPEGKDSLTFRPVIDRVIPFSEKGVEDAFTHLHSRRARGKVVLKMK